MADVVGMYFLTVHRFTMQNLTSEFDMNFVIHALSLQLNFVSSRSTHTGLSMVAKRSACDALICSSLVLGLTVTVCNQKHQQGY